MPTEPTIVPVAIDDLDTILTVVGAALDLTGVEAAAYSRLAAAWQTGNTARASFRAAHPRLDPELDLVGEAGANVYAGPGATLPASHRGGHTTEVQAARRIDLVAGTLRARALAELVRAGDRGLTDVELERILGVNRPTGGNRRGELVKLGHVEAGIAATLADGSQVPRTRTVAPHGPAKVWIATHDGRRALRDLGYRLDAVHAMHGVDSYLVTDPEPAPIG